MKQQENRAEPKEKQIRFIDSHYNLKFYIPDGGKSGLLFVMDTQQTECASILMTTICMSEIAAIIYASLLKKWSLMEAKLNLSINPNRQKTRPKTEKNSDKEVQE